MDQIQSLGMRRAVPWSVSQRAIACCRCRQRKKRVSLQKNNHPGWQLDEWTNPASSATNGGLCAENAPNPMPVRNLLLITLCPLCVCEDEGLTRGPECVPLLPKKSAMAKHPPLAYGTVPCGSPDQNYVVAADINLVATSIFLRSASLLSKLD